MPELPEVQTIADDLNRKVKNSVITHFWTDWPKVVKHPTISRFKKEIRGAKIKRVTRIGKNIILHLDKDRVLLVHQKMTGHLMVGRWDVGGGKVKTLIKGVFEDRVNQYIHAIFYLKNGQMIALSDMRKFGRIAFGPKEEIFQLPDIKNLGPDALDPKLNIGILQEKFSKTKRPIKSVLMDPKIIAGIGNIYADEILWSAKVHPLTPANKIGEQQIRAILKYIKVILNKALKLRGTSSGDYRDSYGERGKYGDNILIYQQDRSPCKRCKTPIVKIKVGQRSAHFCPQCQEV